MRTRTGRYKIEEHGPIPQVPRPAQTHLKIQLIGIALVGLHFILLGLAPQFSIDENPLSKPVLTLVAIELLAGSLYLIMAAILMREHKSSKALLIYIVTIGVILRLTMLGSTPMLEDDYHRYFWDGAVVAQGVNPYSYSPQAILERDKNPGSIPHSLDQLALKSGNVLSQINHPSLPSIYPPVTQGAFALAHWLSPWRLWGWRLILFVFDLCNLALLVLIIRRLQLPLPWMAIYWWNPLLVKEIYNSGHMEVIALFFLLGTLFLMIQGNQLSAIACLALGTATKLWPAVLLPLLLRPLIASPKRCLAGLFLFCGLVALLFFPVYRAGWHGIAAFVAYGKRWELNDGLFQLIGLGTEFFQKTMGLSPRNIGEVSRLIPMAALALWITWVACKRVDGPLDLCEKSLWIVAGVFLLSPTQFPWYYLWLLPLLALRPRISLLLMTVLLPIYYLRYYFEPRGKAGLFDHGIVWIEHIPIWILLIREWFLAKLQSSSSSLEVTV